MNSSNKYLKYRVYSVSSESISGMCMGFPSAQSNWESERSCTYPQQMTIQFLLPMLTKSLRITFHQYKIPSLVEVFIKAVSKEKYRRLGFIRPSSNEQTGFEEREVKTVYFEFPCSFIKLVLHRNYQNEYNIFNQVAIEEIQVEGELMPPDMLSAYDCKEVVSSEDEEIQEEIVEYGRRNTEQSALKERQEYARQAAPGGILVQKRQQLRKVYNFLEKKKTEAVQNEDYSAAAQIKAEITKFMEYERKLNQLEDSKRAALEDEDYDKCAQIKSTISSIKQNLEFEITKTMNSTISNSASLGAQSEYTTEQRSSSHFEMKNMTAIPVRYMDYSSIGTAEKSQVYNATPTYQNQIVPAVLHKQNPNTQSNIPQEFPPSEEKIQLVRLESLDTKLLNRIEQYFPYIKEDIWRGALMKNWKIKEQAFSELSKMEVDSKEKAIASLELCALTINDKHPNIIIHTLLLINKVIKSGLQMPAPAHPPLYVSDILNGLINLFVQSNPKIKELAAETYADIVQIPLFQISFVVGTLINKKQFKALKHNPKSLYTKLIVATQMTTRFDFPEETYDDVLDWAVMCLEDSNREVRTAAGELITTGLMPIVGEEIVKQRVKNVRSNILQSFMLQLNQSLSMERSQNQELLRPTHRTTTQNTDRGSLHHNPSTHNISGLHNNMSSVNQQKKGSQGNLHYSRNSKETEHRDYRGGSDRKIENSQFYEYSQMAEESIHEKETPVLTIEDSHQYIPGSESKQQDPQESMQDTISYKQELCDYCNQPLIMQPHHQDMDHAFREHVVSDCKVLVSCEECGARIYIRELTMHLLKECERANYQQCKRCKLAYDYDEIYEHEARQLCRNATAGYERCQLCNKNVAPNDSAWIAHVDHCDKH